MLDCGLAGTWFAFASYLKTDHLDFPPVVHDWVIKRLGMYTHVLATEHMTGPVPLVEKTRASCPGGRLPPSFTYLAVAEALNPNKPNQTIHQVINITGLNTL